MEKRLEPKLRFPEFSREWKSYRIGDLTDIKSASRVLKNQWTESGVPFFRTSDVIAEYKGLENTKAFISMELFNELSKKSGRARKNDLLVTGGGSIGIPYLIKTDEPLYFKDADLLWFKNTNQLNGVFLYTFLLTGIFRRYLNSITHTGTISHYTIEQAKSTPIKVPVYQEQEKIASFLSTVDSKIEKLEKKKELLSDYKKGMMQKIFSQEIRFKDRNGEEYPQWEEKRLGEICDISTGKSKSKYIEETGDYFILDMGSISKEGKLLATKKTNLLEDLLHKNDLIMAKDDIGGGNIIGKVIIVPEDKKYICGDHVYKLSVINENAKYIYFVINSYCINKSFRQKANGTAQIGITNDTVKKQLVLIPCLEEQEKIADFLSSIDRKIELVEKEIEKNKEFKKGLLQQMFV